MRRLKRVLRFLAVLAAVLAAVTWAVFQRPQFGGRFEGARLDRMRRSPEFRGGRFENDPRASMDASLRKNFELYSQGQIREPWFAIPVLPLSPAELNAPPARELRAIWLGHASVLLELGGVRVITDPVFSDVASPLPMGPRRFHATPIKLDDLTHIDAVVITHDHYDHLDMSVVKHLAPLGTQFFVPLGIGAHLERWGVPSVLIHEMDWWERAQFKGLTFDCTPARHYSGRKRMDNSTLWSSWVIRGAGRSVFLSGDGGYGAHFKEIRRRFGPMDLTLMKVGAYGDTWLDVHMDPERAVATHRDLDGRVMLPVHWATFNLSYHSWDEPILRTLAAARKSNVDVITPRVGEVFTFAQPFRNVAWYEPQKR